MFAAVWRGKEGEWCKKYDPSKAGVGLQPKSWNQNDAYPDLSIPPSNDGIKFEFGAPCRWKTDAAFPYDPVISDGGEPANLEQKMYGVSTTFLQTAVSLDSKINAQYISHRGVYCHLGKLGPAGCWRGEENKCKCHRESMNEHEATRNPKNYRLEYKPNRTNAQTY